MTDARPKIRVPLLDLSVTPMTANDIVALVSERPTGPELLLNHNLHSAYLYSQNESFRQLYSKSSIIVIDGWPILTLASVKGPLSSDYRIGSTDWISRLWSDASVGPLRVFILGASEDVNERALARWSAARPDDAVAGSSGYFDEKDEPDLIRRIWGHNPQIILVGMGMPIQEQFLIRHLQEMPPAYIATVGGAIDYISGEVALSPRWLGRLGLEWVWRFAHDPSRLFERYFIEPFKLASALLHKRYIRKVEW